MILELQFAFLQASQLKFLMPQIMDQRLDHCVEITMLDLKFDDAALDVLRWIHSHIVAQPVLDWD